MEPIPCYYGSVNSWECDENQHLNVRFYADKINQATEIFLRSAHGLDADVNAERLRSQHIRFVREARMADPLRIDCAPVTIDASRAVVLALMRHNLTGEPVAAFLSELQIPAPGLKPGAEPFPPPDWAVPRGLDPGDPYPEQSTLEQALENGFTVIGRGVISNAECDAAGRLRPAAYIARLSDGMPNLWAFLSNAEEAERRREGEQGGAALEYRLDYFEPLRAGDVFSQLSGIRSLGNKTQHMVHMVFNQTRGTLAARAEAVGVAMDLKTRKAVPISEERRERLKRLMLA